MSIDLSNAKIGQAIIATDNAKVTVTNGKYSGKEIAKMIPGDIDGAINDVQCYIDEVPEREKKVVNEQIEVLKGEIVSTKPNLSVVTKSLSLLEQAASLIVNAPRAAKAITGLVILVKGFLGI